MAGRKPTPTAIKALRGNPGKRPLNTNEPKAARGIPRPPSYLDKDARKVWREYGQRLDEMKVITVADGPALEMLVMAYVEWRAARDAVVKHGQTYETSTQNGKIVRARPEVAMAGDAWRRFTSMLRDFGLTPSSRSKVAATGGEESANPFMRLIG